MDAELTNLESLRDEIDKIDEVIVPSVDSRARCAYTVGRLNISSAGRSMSGPRSRGIAHVRQVTRRSGGHSTATLWRGLQRIMDEARASSGLEAARDSQRDNENK